MKILRSSTLAVLAVALTLCSATPILAASLQHKPQPPLQISIEPVLSGVTQESIKAGDIVDLKVVAVSRVDTTEMRIEVTLSDGADLISGDLVWTGTAIKNEAKILPITIQVPLKGKGSVRAQLSITLSGGSAYKASSEYSLGGSKKRKPESTHPVRKDSKGNDVLEYR